MAQVETLLEVARSLAAQVAPAVVEHEAVVRGYVPVFIDGTVIDVDGKLFEEAWRPAPVLAARGVHRRAVGERPAASR